MRFTYTFSQARTVLLMLAPFLAVLFFPYVSLAADPYTYVPLVTIPGVENTANGNLPEYLNKIYLLTISLGALIAVVKIIIAGVKWSFSGIVTDKAEARQDIKGALLGLTILLVPFLVLREINPDLTNLNFLRSSDAIKVELSTKPTSPNTTGDWGQPIDYEITTLTIPQSEFDTYTDTNIYVWYERCGGPENFRVNASSGNVTLSCASTNTGTSPSQTTTQTTGNTSGSQSSSDPCGGGNCQDLTF